MAVDGDLHGVARVAEQVRHVQFVGRPRQQRLRAPVDGDPERHAAPGGDAQEDAPLRVWPPADREGVGHVARVVLQSLRHPVADVQRRGGRAHDALVPDAEGAHEIDRLETGQVFVVPAAQHERVLAFPQAGQGDAADRGIHPEALVLRFHHFAVERDRVEVGPFEAEHDGLRRHRLAGEGVGQRERQVLLRFALAGHPRLDHVSAARPGAERGAQFLVDREDELLLVGDHAVHRAARVVEHHHVRLGQLELERRGRERRALREGPVAQARRLRPAGFLLCDDEEPRLEAAERAGDDVGPFFAREVHAVHGAGHGIDLVDVAARARPDPQHGAGVFEDALAHELRLHLVRRRGHRHRGVADEERQRALALAHEVERRLRLDAVLRDRDAARDGRDRRSGVRDGAGREGLERLRRRLGHDAVHARRRLADGADRAARRREVGEQLQRARADREHFGHHDGLVGGLRDDELSALDAGVPGHDVLGAVVEVQIGAEQGAAEREERMVDLPGGRRVARDLDGPDGLDGVEHEQVADLLEALGEEHLADAREVVLRGAVYTVPRRLAEDARGVVALGGRLHRIPGEMLAAQVDAQRHLPVAEGLVAFEREVPARAAVRLGEAAAAAELVRHRGALLGGPVDGQMLGEQVDARRLHVFVEAHRLADDVRLRGQVVLREKVAGVLEAVPAAPVADALAEGVHEELRGGVGEVQADLGEGLAADLEEEFG